MQLEISESNLKRFILKFFPSLIKYPDQYLPTIFDKYSSPTNHLTYLCPLCL
jgi:hypothetical protein